MINWKKGIKAVIGIVCICIIVYLLYVLLSYKRIKDNLPLKVNRNSTIESVKTGQSYQIMTYNIGFGAYTPEFTFFMDGGKSSIAKSKESVVTCVKGAANVAKDYHPDFLLLQEVDLKATRSYHVNEKEIFDSMFPEFDNQAAVIYDSAFLFYPIWEPHGKSLSTIACYSRPKMQSAIRRSLPISEDMHKFLDLDRCYSKSRVFVEGGKYLCVYNVHLSAYGNDASIRLAQIKMLTSDMGYEYGEGNYIVCGGDFNHDLLNFEEDSKKVESWAHPFPRTELPNHFMFALDLLSLEKRGLQAKSSRSNDIPYDVEKSFVVTLDGFIVSDNIEVVTYEVVDTGFGYSDHNPVSMQFELKM